MMRSVRKLSLVFTVFIISFVSGCDRSVKYEPIQAAKPTPEVNDNGAALLYAAGTGNIAMAKELLAQGVDVNFRGPALNTPIMEAAFAGHLEMAKFLLAQGADLSAKKRDGETPTTLAGAHKEVSQLFKNVADLVEAARKGDKKTLNQLIDRGIPVNAIDPYGHTALSESCWNGHTETVKLLLAKGADPKLKKPDGESPLTLAAARKHPDIVALLTQAIGQETQPQEAK